MEKQQSNHFLNHFKLFKNQNTNIRNTIQKRTINHTFQQSPITLFFIHPNILFPHPKNKNQQQLITTTQQGFKKYNQKRNSSINTSYSFNRKCKTADVRRNRNKYQKRLKQYIRMQKLYKQFKNNGYFIK